jgi:hypothetical protein
MAERRARREGEEAGRKQTKAAEQLDEAARGLKSGWYDKKEAATYFACSVRMVERWMAEGMPHVLLAGKVKFKPADECEPWLVEHGLFERRGERREKARLALSDQVAGAEGLLDDRDLELPEDCVTDVRRLLEEAHRKIEAERGDS